MCGIAGRILSAPGRVGHDLVELMDAQEHRGADSTGFAVYGPPVDEGFIVRVMGADRAKLSTDLEDFLSIHTSLTNDIDTGNADENDARLWALAVPMSLDVGGGMGVTPYYLRYDGQNTVAGAPDLLGGDSATFSYSETFASAGAALGSADLDRAVERVRALLE